MHADNYTAEVQVHHNTNFHICTKKLVRVAECCYPLAKLLVHLTKFTFLGYSSTTVQLHSELSFKCFPVKPEVQRVLGVMF